MSAENIGTTVGQDIGRGGFPSVGPKVGLVQNTIDFDDVTYGEAGDWVSVFTFKAPTLVLAAGMYVVTAATDTSSTIALGTGGSNVLMAAVAMATAADVGALPSGRLLCISRLTPFLRLPWLRPLAPGRRFDSGP